MPGDQEQVAPSEVVEEEEATMVEEAGEQAQAEVLPLTGSASSNPTRLLIDLCHLCFFDLF